MSTYAAPIFARDSGLLHIPDNERVLAALVGASDFTIAACDVALPILAEAHVDLGEELPAADRKHAALLDVRICRAEGLGGAFGKPLAGEGE
jgi:hypothetical protein